MYHRSENSAQVAQNLANLRFLRVSKFFPRNFFLVGRSGFLSSPSEDGRGVVIGKPSFFRKNRPA